eukprot:TRINITY_DN1195_c0_g1_i2.p1 TRINITY_DN1195_c0_g1~~TRINITY_DN1195_c0_g1_i2.p1  ORF type:complete len:152 (-),score=29.41 TRINITY_DN1195_c0_g1_i2:258-713(-)
MLARANNIAGNVPRGCAGGRSRSGGFCRRSRHDWQPVLEALSVLEARQAAVQKEMQALRESAACQLEASRQAVAKKDEEIAGIRAASAAAAFQFQRQHAAETNFDFTLVVEQGTALLLAGPPWRARKRSELKVWGFRRKPRRGLRRYPSRR